MNLSVESTLRAVERNANPPGESRRNYDACNFMDHLAHFLLAAPDPEIMLGSFIADDIRGAVDESLPAGVIRGVGLHRWVDSYTDSSPLAAATRRHFAPQFGHYASILADVAYDAILSAEFEQYSTQSLEEFSDEIYSLLIREQRYLPESMKTRVPRMVADKWLTLASSAEGMRRKLSYISRRLSRHPHLEEAVEVFERERETIREEFAHFFPRLREAAAGY